MASSKENFGFRLKKRDCGISMKLVPYGAGWTDVYLNIGEDKLYFIISAVLGDTFTDLLRVLYFLHPENNDPEHEENYIDCWEGLIENNEVVEIAERIDKCPCTIRPIPKKGEFIWDEEGSESKWVIEREPTLDTDFDIRISIDICRDETEHYEYTVRYKDFCYAVAKTCTEVLKSHGIYGYHHSIYQDDMHLRYLLFIKSAALDNFEARELTDMGDKNGEGSSFEKEIELLMFDM